MSVVEKYRKAAMKLWGCGEQEARHYIRDPKDDPGEWAPDALVIIYLEPDMRNSWDEAIIPAKLSYYGNGFENCRKLSDEAGVSYIEYINPAVAAVWE